MMVKWGCRVSQGPRTQTGNIQICISGLYNPVTLKINGNELNFHRPSPEGRTLYCLQFSSRFWDLGILPHIQRKMSISLALLVLSPAICSKIRQRDLRYCP